MSQTQTRMQIGIEWENRAEEMLLREGFTIIERGSRQSAYDILAEKKGKKYAINVKGSNSKFFALHEPNISRLMAVRDAIPAFLFYTTKTRTLFLLDNALMPIAEPFGRKVHTHINGQTDHSFRTINIMFEDEEYDALKRAKGAKTWRAFILQLVKLK